MWSKNSKVPLSLLLVILFLSVSQGVAGQGLAVEGFVTDRSTGMPVPGVNIYVPSGRYGTMSDEKGHYSLHVPGGRTRELHISCVGYETVRRAVPSSGSIRLDVSLERSDNMLSDVEVIGTRDAFGPHDAQIGAQRLSSEQIASMPALLGEADVLKSVQRLPGVMSVSDGNAGIMVRGGNYDQNYISLDGIPLYGTEHLKGFVSAINPDVTDVVDVYKGAFPARYGSRLSSVVDVRQKEGDMDEYHGSASVGALSSRLSVGGPLHRGKTSFLAAGRLSYTSAFIQPLIDRVADDGNRLGAYSRMDFYDVNAILTHRFSSRDRLSAVFYLGKDWDGSSPSASSLQTENEDQSLVYQTSQSKANSVENRWGNTAASIRWQRVVSPDLRLSVGLGYTGYHSQMHMSTQSDLQTERMSSGGESELFRRETVESDMRYNSGIREFTGHADLLWSHLHSHEFMAGVRLSSYSLSPFVDSYRKYYRNELVQVDESTSEYRETESILNVRLGRRYREQTASLYVQDDWTPFHALSVSAGMRTSLYRTEGPLRMILEPRLSMRYLLSEDLSVKLGYARMSQGIHLLSSGNLAMPSDLWVPAVSSLDLATSDQVSAGVALRLGQGLSFSLEGYLKNMDGLLEYQEGVTFMNANADWEKMVSQGGGRSYGLELMARKSTGRTTGWVSYTYARSFRKFDRPGMEIASGRQFRASTDRPHTVNVVLTHQTGRHWDFSANWSFQSGRRGTVSTTAYYGGMLDEYTHYGTLENDLKYVQGSFSIHVYPQRFSASDESYAYVRRYVLVSSYRERNAYRLPAFHHLDLSVNYHVRHGRTESVFNLSVYNVYNRQNVSSVYVGYDDNRLVLKGICMFPVLPSLSYTFKF